MQVGNACVWDGRGAVHDSGQAGHSGGTRGENMAGGKAHRRQPELEGAENFADWQSLQEEDGWFRRLLGGIPPALAGSYNMPFPNSR